MDGSSLDFSGKGNCGRWLAEVIGAVGPPGGPREAYRVNRSLTPSPYHPVCDLTPSSLLVLNRSKAPPYFIRSPRRIGNHQTEKEKRERKESRADLDTVN